MWRLDAKSTASHAQRENPGRNLADVVLLGAAVASLIAVGIVLLGAGHANGNLKYLQAGFALASVSVSWIVVHTVSTLRYARLYYSGRVGGIDFNEADLPQYSDFAYLSFTIGMTFQVISVVCWRDADKRLLWTRCGRPVDDLWDTPS